MAGNSTDPGRSVTSKVVAILLSFTDAPRLSLTEIARLAGLPVSTAYRLVNELTSAGVLERTDDQQYQVGGAVRDLADGAADVSSLPERARRVMEDLSAATRAAARLGVLRGGEVLYTERLGETPGGRFLAGRRAPAHASAMGKALLAFSPASTVDALVATGLERYTSYTLTNAEALRRSLSVTRLTRVAVCRSEREVGVSAVAVPVFDGAGVAVAALELSAKDLRTDLRSLQPALIVAARGLSRELAAHGGQPLLDPAPQTARVPGRAARPTRAAAAQEASHLVRLTQPVRAGSARP